MRREMVDAIQGGPQEKAHTGTADWRQGLRIESSSLYRAVESFKQAIEAAGLTPPEDIRADGKLHRFASSGKKADDAGWYVLHADGIPAGCFGDWRSNQFENWCADLGRPLTSVERAAHAAKMVDMRRKREAEEKVRHAEAAAKANALWKAATPVAADHPYLLRKQVAPTVTLREIDVDEATAILGYVPKVRGEQLTSRLLVAPVKIGDVISTCELIDVDGRKSAVYGGAKAAGYWAAQPLPGGDGAGLILLIGEGVATVLSGREATGCLAVAALSSGNLERVAKSMRARYPAARLVIVGDLGNGMDKAEQAARAVGARLAVPAFGDGRPDGATDLNDLAVLHGQEAVKRTIETAEAPAPCPVQRKQKSTGQEEYTSDVELIQASALTPEPVKWLWRDWLAEGKMHIIGGAPGTGKTTIAMALAAIVTKGGRWPDGMRSPVGNVVIWSGEDDPRDTLIPRLELAGADRSRVYFIADVREGNERRSFDPARDMDMLRRKLGDVGDVRLLIVDPIVSAVAGDSHKNTEVRRSLQPLVDLAASMRCALLGITHLTKGTSGRDPVERLTGSLAFGAVARVVMLAAKSREECDDGRAVRLFLRAKSNIGPDDGGFQYDLGQEELESHPGIIASSVKWGGQVAGSARELLATAETAGDDGEGGALGDAKQFLYDLLANGAMPVKILKTEAADAGYSMATIRRAKDALGVEAVKTGMKSGWKWALPRRCSGNSEDAQPNEMSTFGNPEHLHGDFDIIKVEV